MQEKELLDQFKEYLRDKIFENHKKNALNGT